MFLISGLGWFVSVVFGVVTLGKFRLAANVFGYIAVFSLPITMLIAIVHKKK